MKVRVMKPFIDKYSGEYYKVGRSLDISEERYEEICNTNSKLVAKVKETAKATKAAE